jgi:hypothetical protein
MASSYDLEQLQRKLARLEAELGEARQQLARLTAAGPQPAETEAPAAAANPPTEPLPLPPVLVPLAEPPLLPVSVPETPAATPGGLRIWLEGIGLWPPRGEANTEARLGAWWATRLGALLAVIGVVFFAVYVSRNTPPVVKLAQLVVVAAGALVAGLRFERRVPRFGHVITGAGLALLYFASFAAYVVPATRVIAAPPTAVAVQLGAVAAVLGFAAWRRSEGTAALAVGLGFVTVAFSVIKDLETVSLWAVLALAAGAVALGFRPGWRSPAVLALPLAYFGYVAHGTSAWSGLHPPVTMAALWLPLLALYGLFLLRAAVEAARGAELPHDDRLLQNFNASLAIASGFLVTLWALPDSLAAWWFWSGGVMAAVALFWRWSAQPGSLVPVAACKAAGLLALGVLTHWDGHVRWLVLLMQAFVLLVAARSTGIRALRIMMTVVWAFSLLLFFRTQMGGQVVPAAATVVYLVFSALLLGFDERWLGGRRVFSVLGGVMLGACAGYAAGSLWPAGWMPAGLMAAAAVAAGAGRVALGWRGPLATAGFLVIGAHLAMLGYRAELFPAAWLWLNEGVLLAGVIAAGGWLRHTALAADPGAGLLRTLLTGGAVLVLQVVLAKGLSSGVALAASTGVAVILTGLASRLRDWPMVPAGLLALTGGWLVYGPFRTATGDGPWLLAAAAGAWLLPLLLRVLEIRGAVTGSAGNPRLLAVGHGVLATWMTLVALHGNFSGAGLIAATGVAAATVFLSGWWRGVWAVPLASSVILLAGAGWVMQALLDGAAWVRSSDWSALVAVALLAAVALLLPVFARRRIADWAAGWRRAALWLHGGGALGLLLWFFGAQHGAVRPYATVLWGGAAILLFVFGLFARERVYRLFGLAGLVLCVPRAFLVDIDSTLYRIVAFVVLGLVLLWVGFSYHRFRHLLVEPDEGGTEPTKTG